MKKILLILFCCTSLYAGKITFYTGPMFSSKTTHLIKKYKRCLHKGLKVLALKPARDNRYSQRFIMSHNGDSIPAYSFDSFDGLSFMCTGVDAIFIDEIQFALGVIPLMRVLRMFNKKIYCSGLDMDYRRCYWPISADILAIADKVVRLAAPCSRLVDHTQCNNIALYTQRLLNGVPAPLDGDVVLVGGANSYQPRCLECYLDERQ